MLSVAELNTRQIVLQYILVEVVQCNLEVVLQHFWVLEGLQTDFKCLIISLLFKSKHVCHSSVSKFRCTTFL